MTKPQRACERPGCTNFLLGRQKRYCSNACRAISEQAKKRVLAESVALDEVRAQVTPVIKEALTETVLQEIGVMIVRVDEEKKTIERTRTKRQSESERRRVKRGLPPQRQPGEGRSQDRDDLDDDRYDGVEV